MTTHPCEAHDMEAAGARLAGLLGALVGDVRALTDDELQRRLVDVTRLTRMVDVASAQLAAEVAARSGREADHAGLAARQGHRDGESLVRQLCGSSYRDAAALVRVGSAIAAASGAPPGDVDAGGADRQSEAGDERMAAARFGPVLDGLLGGDIALDAADGILRALSPVVGAFDISDVGPVVENLARESRSVHADAVARMAGAARDALDRAGVAEREEFRRLRRFLRIGPEIDGMRRLSGLLDPESAAVIVSAVDAVTAPRRGGPRFVDPSDRHRAVEAVADIRSTEQLALDSVVELIRIAAAVDAGVVFATARPAVRVSIDYADLVRDLERTDRAEGCRSRGSVAFFETSAMPVSAASARRIACDAGILPVVFGGPSELLDVGRTRRLFTGPQRVALAERDGGCRWPGCDRPPSWTEAHHVDPWSAGGRTDLADGLLLCRHHHLLLHNNGWKVVRAAGPGQFALIPPRDIDADARPRPMPPRRRTLAASGPPAASRPVQREALRFSSRVG